jgi:hypothetical protein
MSVIKRRLLLIVETGTVDAKSKLTTRRSDDCDDSRVLMVEAGTVDDMSKLTRADSCEGEVVLRGGSVGKVTDETGRARVRTMCKLTRAGRCDGTVESGGVDSTSTLTRADSCEVG